MMIFLKTILRKVTTRAIVGILGVTMVCYAFFSPSLHQSIGNAFFGTFPKLYNVTLAQFFFTQSAYPIFGEAVPYAHYQLSRTYFIQGKLDLALTEAKEELKLYPENTRTYYILGLTYGYLNQEKLAIESFGTFIEWKPQSWAARNDRAWLQFRIGDIDGALATLKPVANDTNNPWVQNTYGTLLLNKKEYAKAKEAYLNAKKSTDTMTEASWGHAYPGNDPRMYGVGLRAMKASIESNLTLLERY